MEAYKIGVTVGLTNMVSGELAKMLLGFEQTERSVKSLHLAMGKLALVGGAIGFGVMFKDGLDEARKFQNEIARFAAMGYGDAATRDAVKFAKSLDVVGLSYTQNMKLIREATGLVNDPALALKIAPLLAKFESGIAAQMGGEQGEKAGAMIRDLLKVSELRGNIANLPELQKDLDAAMQVYIASGGTITSRDLFNFVKTGGAAAKGLSREAFYFQEYHQMQESGGFRAGTSLMSNVQNLVLGRATHQSIEQLIELGLLNKDQVLYDKIGKVKGVKPGALVDTLMFLNSQFEWYEKNLAPKLAGLDPHNDADRAKAITIIAGLTSNRTAANRNTGFFLEEANIKRAVERAHSGDTVTGLYNREQATYQQAVNDLTAKWTDSLINLGTQGLPIATYALKKFTDVLGWFNSGGPNNWLWKMIKPNDADTAAAVALGGGYDNSKNWADKVTAGFGPATRGALGDVTPPSRFKGQAQQAGDVFLDGDKVGKHVIGGLLRQSFVPNAGISTFDGRQSFAAPGAQ